jgi:hypothetical protein
MKRAKGLGKCVRRFAAAAAAKLVSDLASEIFTKAQEHTLCHQGDPMVTKHKHIQDREGAGSPSVKSVQAPTLNGEPISLKVELESVA